MKTKKLSSKKKYPYYIAPPIKEMLNKGREKVVDKDWDRVYLIDGNEGSGKSLLGLQLGYYLDPTLNLDRITFSGDEFSKAIDKAKKGECIIFDEAFNGLSSTGATSKMNRFIVRKLMECRQKNLFIIIILPTFFLLQKYAAIFRSKALFHVYATRRGDRGYYRVYNELNKKILYINGVKLYSYAKPYIQKSFRFSNIYPIDEQEYRNKKSESLKDNPDDRIVEKYYFFFGVMCKLLKQKFKFPYTGMEGYLKEHNLTIDDGTIGRIVGKIPITSHSA